MDESITPPSKQPRRFFDVAPPQQYQPSTTSKPVIVSNYPQQQDNTLVAAPSTVSSQSASTNRGLSLKINPQGDVTAVKTLAVDPIVAKPPRPSTPHQASFVVTKPVNEPGSQAVVSQVAPAPQPQVTASPTVVTHRKSSMAHTRRWLVLLCGIIVWSIILIDLLLDTGVWKTSQTIPHTHFFTNRTY